MTGAESALQSRILRSFDRYRQPSASPSLKALGKRLVGELLGEAEFVTATLDPAFGVVMHSGGTAVALPGSVIAEGVAAQAAAGVLMWTEFDDLVVEGDSIAASGVMLTLRLTECDLASTPVGLFLRFKGGRMASEVAFMGAPHAADVSAQQMPSVDVLRATLIPVD